MGVATIGSALVEKRLELGLDKGQAAEVIGMSRTTYSSYEQDSQVRPSTSFRRFAEFLGISTEMLLISTGDVHRGNSPFPGTHCITGG